METKKTKKEIVKMLLDNKEMNIDDEDQLLDLLVDEPISTDALKEEEKNIKWGDKIADNITKFVGSWTFILSFSAFLILWIILNLYWIDNLDPYPFILLNLLLSCIAALQAPIIMMSQNREAKRDSLRSKNDYRVDLKSELILEKLYDKMDRIEKNQKVILNELQLEKNTKIMERK